VTPAPRGRSGLVEVLTAQGGESFYRLVRSDPPMLDSFRSQRELGGRRQPRPNALFLLAVGVSMFDTLDGALRVALRRPVLVAEVMLKADRGISFAQTGQPGHHTIWGTPETLRDCVVRVIRAP
jgi:hypothetical protein